MRLQPKLVPGKEVLLCVLMTNICVFKFSKNNHFRDRFLLNIFATENYFNMGVLKYEVPLIVIIAMKK